MKEFKMMTAKEAYEKTKAAKNKIVDEQLKRIEEHIRRAADKGDTSIYYREPMDAGVREVLNKAGYTVTAPTINEAPLISWGDVESKDKEEK